jgi:hypothetical protein
VANVFSWNQQFFSGGRRRTISFCPPSPLFVFVLAGRSFGSSWFVVVQLCSGGLRCSLFSAHTRLPALVSSEVLKVGGGDVILPCSVFLNPWGSVPFSAGGCWFVFNLCRSVKCSLDIRFSLWWLDCDCLAGNSNIIDCWRNQFCWKLSTH